MAAFAAQCTELAANSEDWLDSLISTPAISADDRTQDDQSLVHLVFNTTVSPMQCTPCVGPIVGLR